MYHACKTFLLSAYSVPDMSRHEGESTEQSKSSVFMESVCFFQDDGIRAAVHCRTLGEPRECVPWMSCAQLARLYTPALSHVRCSVLAKPPSLPSRNGCCTCLTYLSDPTPAPVLSSQHSRSHSHLCSGPPGAPAYSEQSQPLTTSLTSSSAPLPLVLLFQPPHLLSSP